MVSAAYGRQVAADDVRLLDRDQAAPARPAPRARRHRARGPQAQPAAGAALPLGRHRPGGHPAAHRPVRGAVPPRGRRPSSSRRSRPSRRGCCSPRGWPRPRTRPSTSRCCCCSSSRSPSSRRASTSSATPRPAATAAPRRARWAPASTSSGRRSTPTSPTATGSAAAAGCAPTSAASTSTRSWPWRCSASGLVTGWDALLLIVATQILQMVRQLAPMVRFDGYHVLADLTGVPDLYHADRARPCAACCPALGRRPGHGAEAVGAGGGDSVGAGRRAAAAVHARAHGPGAAAGARHRVGQPGKQAHALTVDWAGGDVVGGGGQGAGDRRRLAAGARVAAHPRPAGPERHRLACGGRPRGRPGRRAVAVLVAVALVAGLAWAWWPDADRYRPIQAYERGTVIDGLAASGVVRSPAAGRPGRQRASARCGPRRDAADQATIPSSRSSWSPRALLAAARRRRARRGSSRSTARAARSGRQPGARGQHHGRVVDATTSRSPWSGPTAAA